MTKPLTQAYTKYLDDIEKDTSNLIAITSNSVFNTIDITSNLLAEYIISVDDNSIENTSNIDYLLDHVYSRYNYLNDLNTSIDNNNFRLDVLTDLDKKLYLKNDIQIKTLNLKETINSKINFQTRRDGGTGPVNNNAYISLNNPFNKFEFYYENPTLIPEYEAQERPNEYPINFKINDKNKLIITYDNVTIDNLIVKNVSENKADIILKNNSKIKFYNDIDDDFGYLNKNEIRILGNQVNKRKTLMEDFSSIRNSYIAEKTVFYDYSKILNFESNFYGENYTSVAIFDSGDGENASQDYTNSDSITIKIPNFKTDKKYISFRGQYDRKITSYNLGNILKTNTEIKIDYVVGNDSNGGPAPLPNQNLIIKYYDSDFNTVITDNDNIHLWTDQSDTSSSKQYIYTLKEQDIDISYFEISDSLEIINTNYSESFAYAITNIQISYDYNGTNDSIVKLENLPLQNTNDNQLWIDKNGFVKIGDQQDKFDDIRFIKERLSVGQNVPVNNLSTLYIDGDINYTGDLIKGNAKLQGWGTEIDNSTTVPLYYYDGTVISGSRHQYEAIINITGDICQGKYSDIKKRGLLIQNYTLTKSIGIGFDTIAQSGSENDGDINIRSKGESGKINLGNNTSEYLSLYKEGLDETDKDCVNLDIGYLKYTGDRINPTSSRLRFASSRGTSFIYDDCTIERRVYESLNDLDKSELLLYSGKKTGVNSDRIRLKGNTLLFDTYNSSSDKNTVSTKLLINEDGKVGIGTNDPHSILHIKSIDSKIILEGNDDTDNCSIEITSKSDNINKPKLVIETIGTDTQEKCNIKSVNNHSLNFYTYNTERLIIDNQGKIGIGKVPENQKFELKDGNILIDNDNQNAHIKISSFNDVTNILTSVQFLNDYQKNCFIINTNYKNTLNKEEFDNNIYINSKNGNITIGDGETNIDNAISNTNKLNIEGDIDITGKYKKDNIDISIWGNTINNSSTNTNIYYWDGNTIFNSDKPDGNHPSDNIVNSVVTIVGDIDAKYGLLIRNILETKSIGINSENIIQLGKENNIPINIRSKGTSAVNFGNHNNVFSSFYKNSTSTDNCVNFDLGYKFADIHKNGTSRIRLASDASSDSLFDNAVIERRKYDNFDNSELLIFSGSNVGDNIRFKSSSLLFDTYSAITTDRQEQSTKMIIDKYGNVGIGNTSPQSILHISNSSEDLFKVSDSGLTIFKDILTNSDLINIGSEATSFYRIYSSNLNIINDVKVDGKLTVNNLDVIGELTTIKTNDYTTENLTIHNTSRDGPSLKILHNDDGSTNPLSILDIYKNNGEADDIKLVSINNQGNLGLVGNIKFTGTNFIKFQNSSDDRYINILYNNTDNELTINSQEFNDIIKINKNIQKNIMCTGINNNTPNHELDVKGNINFTNALLKDNEPWRPEQPYNLDQVIKLKYSEYKDTALITFGNNLPNKIYNTFYDLVPDLNIKITPAAINSHILISVNLYLACQTSRWGARLYKKIGNGSFENVSDANNNNLNVDNYCPVWFSGNPDDNNRDNTEGKKILSNYTAVFLDKNIGITQDQLDTYFLENQNGNSPDDLIEYGVYFTILESDSTTHTSSLSINMPYYDTIFDNKVPLTISTMKAEEIWKNHTEYYPTLNTIYIDSLTNNIGIGTMTPDSKVHIQEDNEDLLKITKTDIKTFKNILPDTNNKIDLGSSEFKFKELFLEKNSIWLGDLHNISVGNSDNVLKIRKLDNEMIPSLIAIVKDGDIDHSNSVNILDNIKLLYPNANLEYLNQIKPFQWLEYYNTYIKSQDKMEELTIEELFRDDSNYSEISKTDIWLNDINNPNFIYLNDKYRIGIGTKIISTNTLLDVKENIRIHYFNDKNKSHYLQRKENYFAIINNNYDKDQIKIYDDTNENYIVCRNNNVGIGTDNPNQKLVVDGTIKIIEDNNRLIRFADKLDDSTSKKWDFIYTEQNNLNLDYGDGISHFVNKFTFDNTGNFGIGINSPNVLLEIGDNITDSDISTNKIFGISQQKGKHRWDFIMTNYGKYTNDRYDLEIKPNNIDPNIIKTGNIILNPTLNIGIGTNNPAKKLHIQDTNNESFIRIETDKSYTDVNQVSGIEFGIKNLLSSKRSKIQSSILSADNKSDITFYTKDSQNINSFERMKIDFNGNIGIGTIDPHSILHIKSIDSKIILEGNSTYDTDNCSIEITSKSDNINKPKLVIETIGTDTQEKCNIKSVNNHSLNFYTYNTERLIIDNQGNVGIGKILDNSKLSVFNNDSTSNWKCKTLFGNDNIAFVSGINNNKISLGGYKSSSGGWDWEENIYINPTLNESLGYVGIGIETSENIESKLHINGDITCGFDQNYGNVKLSRYIPSLDQDKNNGKGYFSIGYSDPTSPTSISIDFNPNDKILNILQNGKIGINTYEPTSLFHIGSNSYENDSFITINSKNKDSTNKYLKQGINLIDSDNKGWYLYNHSLDNKFIFGKYNSISDHDNFITILHNNKNIGFNTVPDTNFHIKTNQNSYFKINHNSDIIFKNNNLNSKKWIINHNYLDDNVSEANNENKIYDSFVLSYKDHTGTDDTVDVTNILSINTNGNIGLNILKPTVSFEFNTSDAIKLPKGNNSNRPVNDNLFSQEISEYIGCIRYNTELKQFEGYGDGNVWGSLGGVKDINRDTYITAEKSPNEDKLKFYTRDFQRLIIDESGNIGVGIEPKEEAKYSEIFNIRGSLYCDSIKFEHSVNGANNIYTYFDGTYKSLHNKITFDNPFLSYNDNTSSLSFLYDIDHFGFNSDNKFINNVITDYAVKDEESNSYKLNYTKIKTPEPEQISIFNESVNHKYNSDFSNLNQNIIARYIFNYNGLHIIDNKPQNSYNKYNLIMKGTPFISNDSVDNTKSIYLNGTNYLESIDKINLLGTNSVCTFTFWLKLNDYVKNSILFSIKDLLNVSINDNKLNVIDITSDSYHQEPIIESLSYFDYSVIDDNSLIIYYKFDNDPTKDYNIINYGTTGSKFNAKINTKNYGIKKIQGDISDYKYTWEGTNYNPIYGNWIDLPSNILESIRYDFTISFWSIDNIIHNNDYDTTLLFVNNELKDKTNLTISNAEENNLLLSFKIPNKDNYVIFKIGNSFGISYEVSKFIKMKPGELNNWIIQKVVKQNKMTLKIYKNSELLVENTFDNILFPLGNFNCMLGLNASSNYSFLDKSLEDFKVYNKALSQQEIYDIYKSSFITKGSIDYNYNYIVFKHNNIGDNTEYKLKVPEDTTCDILAVGGGGGGGVNGGAGGASGNYQFQQNKLLTSQTTYTINVGRGGNPGNNEIISDNGQNSSIISTGLNTDPDYINITAIGGNKGDNSKTTGSTDGSPQYLYHGGNGVVNNILPSTGIYGSGGYGGIGKDMTHFFGTKVGDNGWFIGGGGGNVSAGAGFATIDNRGCANGGINNYGGGGHGGVDVHNDNDKNFISPLSGKYNTGGGGGGGRLEKWSGGGGSGVVIIRYKKYKNVYEFNNLNSPLNYWNFFTISLKNTNQINLSFNGNTIVNNTLVNNILSNPITKDLYIGGIPNNNSQYNKNLNGKISNFIIFNNDIQQDDINNIYNSYNYLEKKRIASYNFDDQSGYDSINNFNLESYNLKMTENKIERIKYENETNTILEPDQIPTKYNLKYVATDDTIGNDILTSTDYQDSIPKLKIKDQFHTIDYLYDYDININHIDNLIAHYKFDNEYLYRDSSKYNKHLSYTDFNNQKIDYPIYDKYNNSCKFQGNFGFNFVNNNYFDNVTTVSFDIKFPKNKTTEAFIIGGTPIYANNWNIKINNYQLIFTFGTNSYTIININDDNQWRMITIIFSYPISIYINNKRYDTTFNPLAYSFTNLSIGAIKSSTDTSPLPNETYIKDLRFYNTYIFTENDISKIYFNKFTNYDNIDKDYSTLSFKYNNSLDSNDVSYVNKSNLLFRFILNNNFDNNIQSNNISITNNNVEITTKINYDFHFDKNAYFNGTNSKLIISNLNNTYFSNNKYAVPLTISLWFNSEDNISKRYLISLANNTIQLYIQNNKLNYEFNDTLITYNINTYINTNIWYLCTCTLTYISSENTYMISLFINSNLIKNVKFQIINLSIDFGLNNYIGTGTGTNTQNVNYFKGLLSDVRLYNSILKQQDINLIYNNLGTTKYEIKIQQPILCDILMVGGGGSGGFNAGGGGGAGGLVFGNDILLESGNYILEVGKGGELNNINQENNHGRGFDTKLIDSNGKELIITKGGAHGGNPFYSLDNGGSGAGLSSQTYNDNNKGVLSTQQKTFTVFDKKLYGFGNNGGIGRKLEYGNNRSAGGGGGAGGIGYTSGNYDKNIGQNARNNYGGNGGDGLFEVNSFNFKKLFNITDKSIGYHNSDNNVYFAAGGGGSVSANIDPIPGKGGLGGGGNAGSFNQNGYNAINNTGSGGGGSVNANGSILPGKGGSGIILIRFKKNYQTIDLYSSVFSVSFWAKFDSNPSQGNHIFFKQNSEKYKNKYLEFSYDASGQKLKLSTANNEILSTQISNVYNEWKLYTISLDFENKYYAIYYDDIDVYGSIEIDYEINNNFSGYGDFTIGDINNLYDISIKDFNVYDKFLNQTDVGYLYKINNIVEYIENDNKILLFSKVGTYNILFNNNIFVDIFIVKNGKYIVKKNVKLYGNYFVNIREYDGNLYIIKNVNDDIIINDSYLTKNLRDLNPTSDSPDLTASDIDDDIFISTTYDKLDSTTELVAIKYSIKNTSEIVSVIPNGFIFYDENQEWKVKDKLEYDNILNIPWKFSSEDSVYFPGNVRIGTNVSELYPLHIKSSVYNSVNNELIDWSNVNDTGISIKADGAIWTTGVVFSSDRRIKTNIRDISENIALQQILKLKPKIYNYIDPLRTKNEVYGFVAQDVKETFPDAVSTKSDFIPNINIKCVIKDKNTLLLDTNNLDLNTNDSVLIIDCYGVKLEVIITFKNKISIKVDKELEGDYCILYGTKVSDFHTLDKNYIYTLNVCATNQLYNMITEQNKIINEQNDIITKLNNNVNENKKMILELNKKLELIYSKLV
jgi:hypothetical protein